MLFQNSTLTSTPLFAIVENPVPADRFTLSVYSMLGNLVMSETAAGNRHQLNVSALSAGIYVVELRAADQMTHRKLHVSH